MKHIDKENTPAIRTNISKSLVKKNIIKYKKYILRNKVFLESALNFFLKKIKNGRTRIRYKAKLKRDNDSTSPCKYTWYMFNPVNEIINENKFEIRDGGIIIEIIDK